MADHGVVDQGESDEIHLDVSAYGLSVTGLVYPGNADQGATDQSEDYPPNMATGSYSLAGTVDNSYHPPGMGQMWPRGDLDAIDPN